MIAERLLSTKLGQPLFLALKVDQLIHVILKGPCEIDNYGYADVTIKETEAQSIGEADIWMMTFVAKNSPEQGPCPSKVHMVWKEGQAENPANTHSSWADGRKGPCQEPLRHKRAGSRAVLKGKESQS